jgi:hypothetical protein
VAHSAASQVAIPKEYGAIFEPWLMAGAVDLF